MCLQYGWVGYIEYGTVRETRAGLQYIPPNIERDAVQWINHFVAGNSSGVGSCSLAEPVPYSYYHYFD